MIFRYVKIKTPDGELIRLPTIPIRLTCNKQHQDVYALIDSGAELCVFNSSIAKTLKIEVTKGQPLSLSGLVGGSVPGYLHQIKVRIYLTNQVRRVYFCTVAKGVSRWRFLTSYLGDSTR